MTKKGELLLSVGVCICVLACAYGVNKWNDDRIRSPLEQKIDYLESKVKELDDKVDRLNTTIYKMSMGDGE